MRARRSIISAAVIFSLGLISSESPSASDAAPLKIGVLGDHSSAYSNVGGKYLIEAVRMAVEDFGGRIFDRPIEVVTADTQLKPDVASTIARRWFDEGVDVLVDIPSTNMTFAVIPLAEQRGKVVLATSAASSDITGKRCSPNVAHWTYDTYSVARTSPPVLIRAGAKRWFFINQDTATGIAVERDFTQVIKELGGEVVGSVRAPLEASDFSSFLLQAQAANPDVYVIAAAGTAGVTAIKQAVEFGLRTEKNRLVSVFMMPDDVKALGLPLAQGLIYATAFDANLNDETRAFSDRFLKRAGKTPNMNMVGSYSAVLHYLKAVQATGTKDAKAVMAKMRETPIRDVFTSDGELRADGRMSHAMYAVEAKTPAESKNEWDLTKVIATVPASEVVRPLNAGGCPLVK